MRLACSFDEAHYRPLLELSESMWLVVVALIYAAIYFAVSRVVYQPTRYPGGWWHTQAESGAQDVWLRTSDGVRLNAWFVDVPGSGVVHLVPAWQWREPGAPARPFARNGRRGVRGAASGLPRIWQKLRPPHRAWAVSRCRRRIRITHWPGMSAGSDCHRRRIAWLCGGRGSGLPSSVRGLGSRMPVHIAFSYRGNGIAASWPSVRQRIQYAAQGCQGTCARPRHSWRPGRYGASCYGTRGV